MSLLERYLKLLQSILPPISRAVAARLEDASAHAEPWMQLFLTALHTELLDMQARVEEVESHLRHIVSKRGTLKDLCEGALRQLLDFLETFTTVEKRQEAQRKPSQTFPHLERIKQGQEAPNHLTNPSTIYESNILLEKVQNATRPLRMFLEPLSLPEEVHPLNVDDFSPDTVSSIRSMLAELKQSMDLEQTWGCRCHDPHPYLLFLSTLRDKNSDNIQFELDMLLELQNQHDRAWKEAKVYVQVPGENDGLSTHSGNRKSTTRGPSRPISKLCEKSKRDSPMACLGLRLQDTRLFQDKLTPSSLQWTRASPKETLGSLVEAGQIIEPADTLLLALLLSYSVLYLANGQWLPSGWDSTAVRFLKCDTGLPYVLRPLLVSNATKATNFEQQFTTEIHQKPDILRLGIAIFEILFMRPIECYSLEDKPEEPRSSSTNSDFFAACEAQYDLDLDWNVYETAKSAFDACLDLDSMLEIKNSGDDERAYYEYIIRRIIHPLENALSVISGLTPADIDALIVKSTKQALCSPRLSDLSSERQESSRTHRMPSQLTEKEVSQERPEEVGRSGKHKVNKEIADEQKGSSATEYTPKIHDHQEESQIGFSSSRIHKGSQEAGEELSARDRVDSGQDFVSTMVTSEHVPSTEVPLYSSIDESISPVEVAHSSWGQMPPARPPRKTAQEVINDSHVAQQLDSSLEHDTSVIEGTTASGSARKKKFRLPAKFSKADKP